MSADAYCGSVCGALCGVCDDSQSCYSGKCHAPVTTNCEQCSLKLSIIDGDTQNGGPATRIVVAIDYQPTDGEPRPRLADLRLAASHPVHVVDVQQGEALTLAKKQIYRNPATHELWTVKKDGSFQLLAMAADNLERIEPGRLATLTFIADTSKPLSLKLVRRDQIFAPPDADAALQATAYQHPVGMVQQ
jgi:hypothetical protein